MKKFLVTALLTATVAGGTAQVKKSVARLSYRTCTFHFGESNRFILGATTECQP